MGVYDYFKGTCPHCGKDVSDYKGSGKFIGEIQTKIFQPKSIFGLCFRSYRPGDKVPIAQPASIIIGECACCGKIIRAHFDKNILTKYTKV